MMKEPEIKPATVDDALALERLVNSAYRGESSRKGWTTEADILDGTRIDAEVLVQLIKRPDTQILKYTEGGRILACVELQAAEDEMYLGMLTVQPDLQSKGIGKALLKAAEDEARKRKCKRMTMTVISIRSELIAWYMRHGYRDTGKRKPFHFNDPRFGLPKQELEFAVLEKLL